MSHARVRQVIIVLVALQALVLVTLPLQRGARIASGTEVLLAVEPVDPVDLARGAYVELRYDLQDLKVPRGADNGDDAYVVLERPTRDGEAWDGRKVVLDEGDLERGDVFIRLSVDSEDRLNADAIDSYYDNHDGARALERDLASGNAVARVSLAEDGRPRLIDVRRVNPRSDG